MIINTFAEIDTLLDGIIAAMIGGDEVYTGVLLTSVDNRDKCDYITAMIGVSKFPPNIKLRGTKLVERVRRASNLRNSIAHDCWVEGRKRHAIKPLGTKARGKLKVFGLKGDAREWTADELQAEAAKNQRLQRELQNFMKANGLVPRQGSG